MDKSLKEDVLYKIGNDSNKSTINSDNVRINRVLELSKLILKEQDGEELICPISFDIVKEFSTDEIRLIMKVFGLYTFPTTELIDFLKSEIDTDPEYYPDAIEIGAGTGWIGRSLGIPATDLKLQERADIKALYYEAGQETINYPKDVIKMDAVSAIKKYKPEFVIGSYITAKYGTSGKSFGSIYGVDNTWVANNCHKYYLIGNLNIHSKDRLMRRKHEELSFPWLITRGDSEKARIFVFESKCW